MAGEGAVLLQTTLTVAPIWIVAGRYLQIRLEEERGIESFGSEEFSDFLVKSSAGLAVPIAFGIGTLEGSLVMKLSYVALVMWIVYVGGTLLTHFEFGTEIETSKTTAGESQTNETSRPERRPRIRPPDRHQRQNARGDRLH